MQIKKIALITMTMRHAKSEKVVDKEKFGLRLVLGVGDTIIPSSGKSSSSTTSCRKSSRIRAVYQTANKKAHPQANDYLRTGSHYGRLLRISRLLGITHEGMLASMKINS